MLARVILRISVFCFSLSSYISATIVQDLPEEENLEDKKLYDGYQVIRAFPSSHEQLDVLHEIGENIFLR